MKKKLGKSLVAIILEAGFLIGVGLPMNAVGLKSKEGRGIMDNELLVKEYLTDNIELKSDTYRNDAKYGMLTRNTGFYNNDNLLKLV